MSKLDEQNKRAIIFTVVIYGIVGFFPFLYFAAILGFIHHFLFLLYIILWLIFLVFALMLIDGARRKVPDKFNTKGIILTLALIRSGFMTFFILVNILLILLRSLEFLYGENFIITKSFFIFGTLTAFIVTLMLYYFYERKDFETKSFVALRKIDEFQNKWLPFKPIKIEDVPELKTYIRHRNELSNLYDFIGIVITATLLFTSIYTSFEPNTIDNIQDPFKELEFLLILPYMVVYIQAAYYKLPLSFLNEE